MSKFGYVDAFVVPVPKKNKAKYFKMAKLCAKVWTEHGALSYVECVQDNVEKGKVTSFPRSVKLKKDELVAFAYVTFKSRQSRDQVMKKVMADQRLAKMMSDESSWSFDGMRMFWGGFKPVVKF